MDPNCFDQPGNQLIGNFGDSSRNVKLRSKEISNFAGKQAVGHLMYMDTSLLGLLSFEGSVSVIAPGFY